jgi:anti-anti-sigma factor
MKLTHRTEANVQLLVFSGNLQHRDVVRVTQQLQQIIDTHSAYLLIDLAELQTIDVQGLSVLLTALKLSQARGGTVALLNPSKTARNLLTLTDLHRIFAIYADPAVAVADMTHSLELNPINQQLHDDSIP